MLSNKEMTMQQFAAKTKMSRAAITLLDFQDIIMELEGVDTFPIMSKLADLKLALYTTMSDLDVKMESWSNVEIQNTKSA